MVMTVLLASAKVYTLVWLDVLGVEVATQIERFVDDGKARTLLQSQEKEFPTCVVVLTYVRTLL